MNYEILKTELELPAYLSMTDEEAAASLNVRDIPGIKQSMTGSEMFLATDSAEVGSLTEVKRAEWLSFCAIDSHSPANNGLAQQFVNYIFGSNSDTLAALGAARTETLTRAEQLGFGKVRKGDITHARNN